MSVPSEEMWLRTVHGAHFPNIKSSYRKQIPWKELRAAQKAARKAAGVSPEVTAKTEHRKVQNHMILIAEFSADEILPFTGVGMPPETFRVNKKKFMVKMSSPRYATFALSRKCAHCGIEGKVMRLERQRASRGGDSSHFNLYAYREDGLPVLMTRDHIVPTSKNGDDTLANSQTLCTRCNCLKADKMPSEIDQAIGAGLGDGEGALIPLALPIESS
jgi:hypothetical protein